jgi:hypothetical protein
MGKQARRSVLHQALAALGTRKKSLTASVLTQHEFFLRLTIQLSLKDRICSLIGSGWHFRIVGTQATCDAWSTAAQRG